MCVGVSELRVCTVCACVIDFVSLSASACARLFDFVTV